MELEQDRRNAHTITKAILLGYNIEIEGVGTNGTTWYNLQMPNGSWSITDGLPTVFPSKYLAALRALDLSGVL